jgi:sugar transferase (PEP-CTERM/EpsH1 system associated)
MVELTTARIKVAHVLHSFDIGGLENGLVNLINHMDPDRFHHYVCCMTRSGRSAARVHSPNVDILEFDKQPGGNWWLPLMLRRRFREIDPDIVHSRNWGAIDAVVGARLARVPAVVHGEHGRNDVDPDGKVTKHNLVRRALGPMVDRIVCVSEDLGQWLVEDVGIRSEKVRTIHNGVDIDRFRPGNASELRARCGFAADELLIGTVGRLDPIKDQGTLIDAFARLNRDSRPARLLVVGDGPSRGELEESARRAGVASLVTFFGMRDDIAELLRLFDLFVLPSIGEGISNTILEAMASGLPVVATRVGGNPELVAEGETGALVPRRRADALAAALQVYLEDETRLRAHSTAARRRAECRFSLARMVRQYEALYVELASRGAR